MITLKKDLLNIAVFPDRETLGQEAARRIAATIHMLLQEKEYISMVFGAAPSQDETLDALAVDESIDWTRINIFHMDEYVGLTCAAPQLFSRYLSKHLYGKVDFREAFMIDGTAFDLDEECDRYAALLTKYQTDIVCMGIGENTHIAFNDPFVADFKDKKLVKVVDLDLQCRWQQVNDGCFESLENVPQKAITLTVPALFKASYAFCMVPGERKARAVRTTLTIPNITNECPASILRTHPAATLFLDADSASYLTKVI